MIEISNAVSKRCFSASSDDVEEILDYAQTEILAVGSKGNNSWVSIEKIVMDCVEHCELIAEQKGITGIPSGGVYTNTLSSMSMLL